MSPILAWRCTVCRTPTGIRLSWRGKRTSSDPFAPGFSGDESAMSIIMRTAAEHEAETGHLVKRWAQRGKRKEVVEAQ